MTGLSAPAAGMGALLASALAGGAVLLLLPSPRDRLAARLPQGRAAPVRPSRAASWAGGGGSGSSGAASASPVVPVRLRLGATAGVALAVLLLLPGVTGLVAAVLAGSLAFVRTGQLEPASVRRRRARLEADLPHVVDLLLASVAAGAAPAQALARVAEVSAPGIREELGAWVSRLRLGADPVTVWDDLASHPQLGRLGVTLRRSAESGAPVVEALERLASDLRARQRADVESRVRQVEVKAAVPLGVCLLPAFVLVGVVPLVAGSATTFLAP